MKTDSPLESSQHLTLHHNNIRLGRKILSRILLVLLLVILVGIMLLPIIWMALAAFRSDIDLFASPPALLPPHPSLMAFQYLLGEPRYLLMLVNSYIISISVTALCVFLSFLAGYGFSRFHLKGGNFLLLFTLFSQMFPAVSLIIPFYKILLSIKLINTLAGLILVDTSFILPFCIWMFKSYLDSIPVDLEEAAMVDGAGRLTAMWRVLLPLTLPGFVATAIFAFLGAWNEFTFAVILTQLTSCGANNSRNWKDFRYVYRQMEPNERAGAGCEFTAYDHLYLPAALLGGRYDCRSS